MMGGSKIKPQLVLAVICAFVIQICTSDPLFYESFEENFEGRWIVSEKDDYRGVWKHAKSNGHQDYGLLVSQKGRKYAIVKELNKPISLKHGTIVLQYEVRFQNGLMCGGAYLKYLRPQEAGWFAKEFDNESPYTIMFGPDRCLDTSKIRFILKHKNPKTGDFVEHHLKDPPYVPYNNLTHVYTAIITPNNRLRILVDGMEKMRANFLSSDDFEPPLIPPKTIPDPDDKKPDDWDERAKIPDLEATKPDDWDEDAPMEIEDEDAVKPEGWLDDEPEEIDHPSAKKLVWLDDEPEEIDHPRAKKSKYWNDEVLGKWEAPKIDNPKCEEAPGCGEWKRPKKRNPAYKGKWHAPLIDNPNYKGIWKPRDIPNPECFELEKPNFEPIEAIGIEIWTMQDGILFDNILIADDKKVAASYRETKWKPKYDVEKEKEKLDEAAPGSGALAGLLKKVFNLLYKIADFPFLEAFKIKIPDLIEKEETVRFLISCLLVTIACAPLCAGILLVMCEKEKEPRKAGGGDQQGKEPRKAGGGDQQGKEPRKAGGGGKRRAGLKN